MPYKSPKTRIKRQELKDRHLNHTKLSLVKEICLVWKGKKKQRKNTSKVVDRKNWNLYINLAFIYLLCTFYVWLVISFHSNFEKMRRYLALNLIGRQIINTLLQNMPEAILKNSDLFWQEIFPLNKLVSYHFNTYFVS